MNSTAVLSYPYEGGLFYLMSRENPSGGPSRSHPYYDMLYGPDPISAQADAANLASLFDEVLVPPADEFFPGRDFDSADERRDTDTGIAISQSWDFAVESRSMAKVLMREPEIRNAFIAPGEFHRSEEEAEFIVDRTIQQLGLSIKNHATLVGGRDVRLLVATVFQLVKSDMQPAEQRNAPPFMLSFGDETLELFGFDWECHDYSSFREVRRSKQIREFSAGFRNAIATAGNGPDISQRLLELMREAKENAEVASKAKGFLSITGILSTIIGICPMLGNIASLFSLGSYLGEKNRERAIEGHRWYTIGSALKKVSWESMLERHSKDSTKGTGGVEDLIRP